MPDARRKRNRRLKYRLFAAQRGLCAYCLGRMTIQTTFYPQPADATLDHVVPRSRGGSDDPANLVVAHFACNQAKGDRLDWIPAKIA